MLEKNKRSKNKPRAYDIQRKERTLMSLKLGIRQLKNQVEYKKGKPISKYRLSKQTGISIKTINKFPEITDIINKEANPGVLLKSVVANVSKIYSLEEAVQVINQLTDLYNEVKNKHNEIIKINSSLNLENVRLKNQNAELNRCLNKYLGK